MSEPLKLARQLRKRSDTRFNNYPDNEPTTVELLRQAASVIEQMEREKRETEAFLAEYYHV